MKAIPIVNINLPILCVRKDGTPKRGVKVIFWTREGKSKLKLYDKHYGHFDGVWFNESSNSIENVEYWMPTCISPVRYI